MDKYSFISQLEYELRGLSDDEIESALNYYKELFEDAGSLNEAELIEKLGTPKEIAENIIRESGTIVVEEAVQENVVELEEPKQEKCENENFDKKSSKKTEKKREDGTITLLLIIALFTSPIWLSLMIAFFSVVFTLVIVAFVIIIVFGAIALAGIISGLAIIFAVPPAGMVLLGMGILFTAITLLCTPPLCKGIFHLCRISINATVSLFHGIIYKKGAVA